MSGSSGLGQLLKGLIMGIVLVLAIVGTMSMMDKEDGDTPPPLTTSTETPTDIKAPEISVASQEQEPSASKEPSADKETSATIDKKQDTTNNTTNEDEKLNKEKENTAEVDTKKDDGFKPVLEGEKTAAKIEKERKAAEEAAKPKFGILKLNTIDPNTKKTLLADYVIFNNKNKKVAESNNTGSASYRLRAGTYKVVTTLSQPTSTTRNVEPVQTTQTVVVNENKTVAEVFKLEPPTTIGVLQVSSISAANKQSLKANFIVQKENGVTVATRKNVTHTLFKLKSGSYKVTVRSGNNSDFRTVVIEPGESTSEIFKLQEAITQGTVLIRVFDRKQNKPLPADIIISSIDGKIVKTFKQVAQTEISLPAGKYSVQGIGVDEKSSKSITVVAGKPFSYIFRFDAPLSTKPTEKTASNVPTPEAPTKPEETTAIDTTTAATATDEVENNEKDKSTEVQITDDVKIKGVDDNANTDKETTPATTTANIDKTAAKAIQLGTIKLFARKGDTQKPIFSNFYVQTPNGKNITKKIYANSAEFKLKPGEYKITVRAKGRINIIRNIQVRANNTIGATFNLQKTEAKVAPITKPVVKQVQTPKANLPVRTTSTVKPAKPARSVLVVKPAKPTPKQASIISNGFLNVAMRPAKNTHFIISDSKGKKIVELASVPSGRFKLDVGRYTVTAIHNRQRRTQTIQVHQGKAAQLNFNAADFQAQSKGRQAPPAQAPNNPNKKAIRKGVLRSHIVDNQGRHLRGNLTVTNARGQVVARSNAVTVGNFDLPAGPHTVIVDFQGLRGSEKVNIISGQTTLQTFTITPNNSRPAPAQKAPAKPRRDTNDIIRDKVKEELRRIF